MCDFQIDRAEILGTFEIAPASLEALLQSTARQFPNMVSVTQSGFFIHPEGRPLTRMIARAFDAYEMRSEGHSSAI